MGRWFSTINFPFFSLPFFFLFFLLLLVPLFCRMVFGECVQKEHFFCMYVCRKTFSSKFAFDSKYFKFFLIKKNEWNEKNKMKKKKKIINAARKLCFRYFISLYNSIHSSHSFYFLYIKSRQNKVKATLGAVCSISTTLSLLLSLSFSLSFLVSQCVLVVCKSCSTV